MAVKENVYICTKYTYNTIQNICIDKGILSYFIPTLNTFKKQQSGHFGHFSLMMSLHLVVGFLLLWSCLMALAKTSAFSPLPFVYC